VCQFLLQDTSSRPCLLWLKGLLTLQIGSSLFGSDLAQVAIAISNSSLSLSLATTHVHTHPPIHIHMHGPERWRRKEGPGGRGGWCVRPARMHHAKLAKCVPIKCVLLKVARDKHEGGSLFSPRRIQERSGGCLDDGESVVARLWHIASPSGLPYQRVGLLCGAGSAPWSPNLPCHVWVNSVGYLCPFDLSAPWARACALLVLVSSSMPVS
jgi:hypothetical protein